MITREARYLSINDVGKTVDFTLNCHPTCTAHGPLEKLESLDSHRLAVTVWGERFILPVNTKLTLTGRNYDGKK